MYVSQLKIINTAQSANNVDSTPYERRPETSAYIISGMESIENYYHIVRLLVHEFSIFCLRPVVLRVRRKSCSDESEVMFERGNIRGKVTRGECLYGEITSRSQIAAGKCRLARRIRSRRETKSRLVSVLREQSSRFDKYGVGGRRVVTSRDGRVLEKWCRKIGMVGNVGAKDQDRTVNPGSKLNRLYFSRFDDTPVDA